MILGTRIVSVIRIPLTLLVVMAACCCCGYNEKKLDQDPTNESRLLAKAEFLLIENNDITAIELSLRGLKKVKNERGLDERTDVLHILEKLSGAEFEQVEKSKLNELIVIVTEFVEKSFGAEQDNVIIREPKADSTRPNYVRMEFLFDTGFLSCTSFSDSDLQFVRSNLIDL